MTTARSVTIVGGHGKIALRLARLLSSSGHTVHSLVRAPSHFPDILATGSAPVLLSLESASPAQLTDAFQSTSTDVVVFSAGAGGKGGEERTKAVDYEGALKVFDAVQAMRTPARVLLVSAIDSRDVDKVPAHYTEADLANSLKARAVLGRYMHWKYMADLDLSHRDTFAWTIVRPCWLTDEPATGRVEIGRTRPSGKVSRDDVAQMLALLVDRPDAAGLALDIIGGEQPLEDALDYAITNRITNTYD